MCGICGIVNASTPREEEIKLAVQSLGHRGPDAEGFYDDPQAHLLMAHRRLSIVDLSQNANQPFFSACGRYVMVYNGEVYNHREIAQKRGIKTRTTSDTEVILEAFAQSGAEFVRELNGMFAIAIWDKNEKALHLFRDRVGIKPLFYAQKDGEFLFASEIKALAPFHQFTMDSRAIALFLHLGYIPAPFTIYKEVRKFPQGHYGIWKNGELKLQAYWKAEESIKSKPISFKSETEAKSQLEELVRQAVQYRLMSDVPLGAFLSGGIDSSLVTAFAQQLSAKLVKTFSIGFENGKYNETEHARKVAAHLQTEHHEFILKPKDAIDRVNALLDIYDEPFADSSAIPTLLVSQMARQQITVALSGDGGDELFLGYGMYQWAERMQRPWIKTSKPLLQKLLQNSPKLQHKRAANYFKSHLGDIHSHVFSQEQNLFSLAEIGELLTASELQLDALVPPMPDFGKRFSPAEQQAFFDFCHYLPDDLLVKVDRASMRHSLEVRVPLLDHNLVEFALNLPLEMKKKGATNKWLLKQLLYDYVPEQLFNRPKWGFAIPLADWLQNELRYLVDEHLSRPNIEKFGVVHYETVRLLIQKFRKGETYLYNRIWALVVLHKWLASNASN